MGSPSGEKDRFHNEGPEHQVQIGAPFAVGKFEITRGQFAAFVNDTGYKAMADSVDLGLFTAKR